MRKIIHRFFMLVLVVNSILLLADSVWACSCIELPLDEQIKASTDIVILKLNAVEKYKREEGYGYDGIKQSKLTVQNVFKGNLQIGQEMNFIQGGGGDCIWTFSISEVGKEFLFFLNPKKFMLSSSLKNGLWEAQVCSHSASLKFAAADLLYVEKYKKVSGKTRISGVIYNVTERKTEDKKPWKEWNYEPIAGRKIRVVGKGIDVTLKSDKNGAYEIYDLPIGKYKLIPQKIKGFGVKIPDRILPATDAMFEIKIKAKELVEQNIEYLVD